MKEWLEKHNFIQIRTSMSYHHQNCYFRKNNYIFIEHFLNFVKAQGDKTKSSYQNYHYFLISIKFSNKNNFSNKASHIGNHILSHTQHRKYFGYVLIKDKILL